MSKNQPNGAGQSTSNGGGGDNWDPGGGAVCGPVETGKYFAIIILLSSHHTARVVNAWGYAILLFCLCCYYEVCDQTLMSYQ